MENLSFKDALFLAAQLTDREAMQLPLNSREVRAKWIKKLIDIAEEIRLEANKRHIKTD